MRHEMYARGLTREGGRPVDLIGRGAARREGAVGPRAWPSCSGRGTHRCRSTRQRMGVPREEPPVSAAGGASDIEGTPATPASPRRPPAADRRLRRPDSRRRIRPANDDARPRRRELLLSGNKSPLSDVAFVGGCCEGGTFAEAGQMLRKGTRRMHSLRFAASVRTN